MADEISKSQSVRTNIHATMAWSSTQQNLFTSGTLIWTSLGDVRLRVSKDSQQSTPVNKTREFVSDWYGNTLRFKNQILRHLDVSMTLRNELLERTPVTKMQRLFNAINGDAGSGLGAVLTRRFGYLVLLDDSDVTHKVESCTVSYKSTAYCAEFDIIWKDWQIFQQINCADLPTNFKKERIEILTGYRGQTLVSQGRFFIERRSFNVTYPERVPSSWGRSTPARLAGPYALPITKTWSGETTALAICEEVILGLGVTMSWEIMNYPVLDGKFSVFRSYPIDIVASLAAVVGGIVTTRRDGSIVVRYAWIKG